MDGVSFDECPSPSSQRCWCCWGCPHSYFPEQPAVSPSPPHTGFLCSPRSWRLPVNITLGNDCLQDNSVKKRLGKTQVGRTAVRGLKALSPPPLPPTLSLLGKRPSLCLNLLFWITSSLHTAPDAHILFATSSAKRAPWSVTFLFLVGFVSVSLQAGLLLLSLSRAFWFSSVNLRKLTFPLLFVWNSKITVGFGVTSGKMS